MKRCPQCGREYDLSMSFCLDDGSELLYGPASAVEPQTALLHETAPPSEPQTRAQILTTEQTVLFPSHAAAPSAKRGVNKRLIAAPLALAAVVLGGFFGFRYFNAGGTGTINSIAVLPFENRSGSADADYLSDGLAESLVYRLSQLPGLKVSPTNAVLRYKGAQTDIAAVARELEVDAVMFGRLTQRGDDLTISVELTDARTKKLIWAEQYARKMSDLLTTQREIAGAVSKKLQLQLSGDEAALTKQFTNDNEAYQLYLKGRFFWNKRTPESLRTAIEHFKAAADRDPNFALAYVGIADSYLVGFYNERGKEKEGVPLARGYATRAIEIDPTLAEAHASLGLVNQYEWKWAEAERYYKRALELNPNYPTTLHWYSRSLRSQGRYDEAFELIMRAKQADPLSPAISNNVAESLFERGDIQGAIDESRRGLELGTSWVPYRTMTHSYLQLGRKDEALANARKAAEILPGSAVTLKVLGYFHGAGGDRGEALEIARTIEGLFAKGQADGRDAAVVYAGIGDNDKVFEWLEKDFQSRNPSLAELQMEAAFKPLRGDARFKDLVRRMGLPE
jgi:TolB-like protein/Flp pilus assembly protein TadD